MNKRKDIIICPWQDSSLRLWYSRPMCNNRDNKQLSTAIMSTLAKQNKKEENEHTDRISI